MPAEAKVWTRSFLHRLFWRHWGHSPGRIPGQDYVINGRGITHSESSERKSPLQLRRRRRSCVRHGLVELIALCKHNHRRRPYGFGFGLVVNLVDVREH